MAKWEGADPIEIKPGEVIPLSKENRKIYDAFVANSKDPQVAHSAFQKIFAYMSTQYNDHTIYPMDTFTFTAKFFKRAIGLTKEEWLVVAATGWDFCPERE